MNATMSEIAKGSTLLSLLKYLRASDEALVEQVLAQLPAERRAEIEHATAASEVPFEWMSDLMNATHAVLAPTRPAWSDEAGAYAILSSGKSLYGGILAKATPAEFLTQPVSLFRLYYAPGDMTVVDQDEHRVVMRLVGFDHRNRLFCERQTGGLRATVEVAGGKAGVVKHVRCTEEGDAFCEWEVTWGDPPVASVVREA